MMIMAEEHEGRSLLPRFSFCTSTQMGGRDQRRRPNSPPLSPLRSPSPATLIDQHVEMNMDKTPEINSNKVRESSKVAVLDLKNSFSILDVSYGGGKEDAGELPNSVPWMSKNNLRAGVRHGSEIDGVAMTGDSVAMESNQGTTGDVDPGESGSADRGNKGSVAEGTGSAEAVIAEKLDSPSEVEKGNEGKDPRKEGTEGENSPNKGAEGNDENPQDGLLALMAKMETIDDFMVRMDRRELSLTTTVKNLEESLTFSQRQIDDLRKENADLKKQVGAIDIEDRRTQFQVSTVEGRMDKLETSMKRKNLLFEGIPESLDRKENVGRALEALFDQISVDKDIAFEACYRLGSYDQNRTRPILVTFDKQSDRDMLYAKRFDLRKTKDFQRVWVNEDMGPLSKRKRGLIKLITREAQNQGVDCRSGKYSLTIDKKRFDDDNLDELPPKLHPSLLKQVLIDEKTLAYQSEYAPFSNFFHCPIVIGARKFFCLEQAYQFLRAKILEKPLTATKIFLSRDVYYIKQLGSELGTSDKWDERKFDLMYECLKKKFDQHPELKALLLKTGDLELVEATPDRLWGCGATLSSNVLRRHAWPGKNKHGEMLMTIREEYKRCVTK